MEWLYRLRGDDPAARGRASALMNDAVLLSRSGRRTEAVATGEQAIRLMRSIARTARAEILPQLARAVLDHSTHLSAVDDLAGALRSAEEGLMLAQEVTAAGLGSPDALVLAQANLAVRLIRSGRAGEALPLARAAAGSTTEVTPTARAWILGTLAQALAATGEHAGALTISEQTRAAWQERAETPPPPDDVNLALEQARAMNNHANRLMLAGRWQEAADASAGAVARHRALTGRDPRARRPGLAMALRNQAIILVKVTRWDDSLAASEESLALEREISREEPVAGRPGLAAALSAYATGLALADRGDEARAAKTESLELYRALAATDRVAYLGKLAEVVSDMAFHTDSAEESVRLYEESVGLRRELVDGNRATYLPWLARVLDLLADRLAGLDRLDPALEAGAESVELAREAFAANRAGFLPNYAFILRRQATRLDQAGQSAAAAALGAEAVEASRESVAANRSGQLSGLATALTEQAARIDAAPGAGEHQAQEATAMRTEAAELRAERHRR